MNKMHRVKSRYIRIDHVALDFSRKLNASKPNTVYLHIRRNLVDWNRPVRAMPVYVDDAQGLTLLPDVLLMVRETGDMMARVVSAAATETEIFLTPDFRFVTQFAREDDFYIPLSALGPVNALQVYEKLNEFTWMQSMDFRPARTRTTCTGKL